MVLTFLRQVVELLLNLLEKILSLVALLSEVLFLLEAWLFLKLLEAVRKRRRRGECVRGHIRGERLGERLGRRRERVGEHRALLERAEIEALGGLDTQKTDNLI